MPPVNPSQGFVPPIRLAQAVAQLGWRVIPWKTLGGAKRPAMKGWPDQATTDPAILDTWFHGDFDDCYVGVVTGPESGIWVLDVDRHGEADGFASLAGLERQHGPLPPTFTVRTPGQGEHRYFRWPDGDRVVKTTRSNTADGLDSRGLRGFVGAPGTQTANGTYEVVQDGALIAEAPGWLIAKFAREAFREPGPAARNVTQAGRARAELERSTRVLATTSRSGRNIELNNTAYRLGRYGAHGLVDRDAARAALVDEACALNGLLPDDGQEACDRTFESGWSAGLAKPAWLPRDDEPGAEADGQPGRRNLTDRGNAWRFVDRYGDRVRFLPAHRRWLVWTGKCWQEDTRNQVGTWAGTALRAIYVEASVEEDDDRRAALSKFALKCEAVARLHAVLDLAEVVDQTLVVEPDQLDADSWALNCQNGTLDLKTGELRDHDPADLVTRLCPVRYVEDARDDVWTRVLGEALDPEKLRYLRRFAGYCLTGDTTEKSILVPHGPTNTAKSTIVEPLARALGDVQEGGYATTWDSDVVQADSRVNRNEKVDKQRGTRLIVVGELQKGSRMADEFVKRFSGGDAVDARALYRSSYTLRPQAKLVMHTNYVPRSTDPATRGRLKLLHFPHQIEKPDRALKAHLETSETAWEAILAWAVRGCSEWIEFGGLGDTPWLDEELGRYALDSDPLLSFVDEVLTETDVIADSVHSDLAWKCYEAWGAEAVGRPMKRRAFEFALEERGYDRRRVPARGGTVRWHGLALREDLPEVVRKRVDTEGALGLFAVRSVAV